MRSHDLKGRSDSSSRGRPVGRRGSGPCGWRREHVTLTAERSIESFKSKLCWPRIERTVKALLPGCEFVALAEISSAVAVELQHLTQRRYAQRALARVARKTGAYLGYGAHVCTVRIAAGQHCHTAWRAKRCRIENYCRSTHSRQAVPTSAC